MTEPQSWTLIGVFAAAIFGMITVITQLTMRTISAKFDVVTGRLDNIRTEMNLRFDQLEGRMDKLEGRMDKFEKRMDGLEKRMDGLDADVQAISRRVFPEIP